MKTLKLKKGNRRLVPGSFEPHSCWSFSFWPFLGRKGLTFEAMVVLIIFILVFTVMIIYLKKMSPSISESATRSMCKQSVAIHAGKPLEVFRGEIVCPPDHITIHGSMATPAGQTTAKQALARALFTCWQDFSQGKVDLFTRQGVYCNVCNWIDFEDTKGSVKGLTFYLGETTVPYHDISYLDYLSGFETPHFRDYMNNPSLFDAKESSAAVDIKSTSQRYATIFVYARGEDGINRVKDALAPASLGSGSGGVRESGGRFIGGATAGVMGFVGGGVVPFLMLGTGPAGWVVSGLSSMTLFGVTVYTFSAPTDRPQWMAFPRIVPYAPESFKQLGCERLEVKSLSQ